MMLQALIHYAERENLGDPDFEFADVRWLIPLDRAGQLAGGPISLSDNPDEKKPRPKKMLRPFTSRNELNQGTKSYFLCDSLERSTLFLDPKAEDKAAARKTQHIYFQSLIEEATAHCKQDAASLQALLSFLRDPDRLAALHQQLVAAKAKPTDNAIFHVDGSDLLTLPSLKDFWRSRRHAMKSGTAKRSRRMCIATGKVAETLDTTEKIVGVPGGLAMGTNLISFDKDSFCSFGLEQAQNAALSPEAELKVRSALNALIQHSKNQGLIINDTIHLHWTRNPIVHDPFDILAGADENAVAALLNAHKTGKPPADMDADAYYALSLSGNGARIVVRDWLETTVPEIQSHVAEWFRDLGIIAQDGSGVKRDFKFHALLYSLVRDKLEELPPQLTTQLLFGALRGRSVPLPQSTLAAALRRQQLDQDNKLNPARMAVIKACLLRSPSLSTQNHHSLTSMTESLNLDSRDSAYLCGRLFAVFDRLQYLALGSVNAGVVERYYASASTTPALVMGRLFRNAQFHLAKTEGGIAGNASKDFEAITCALGSQFPASLDLEGQGRFALGYYHQKAEYRRRREERKDQQSPQSIIEKE